jgi:ferric-dicitrate binding protein FerR (iron transport regulator)
MERKEWLVDRLTAQDFQDGPHAAAETLASYVIGALSESEAETLEAHVYACDACSDALAREARLERAFELVAEDLPPQPTVVPLRTPVRIRRGGRLGGVAGAVAIAASALLWLGPGHGRAWPPSEVGSAARVNGSGTTDPSESTHGPDARATEAGPGAEPDAQAQILFARDLDGG